MSPRPESPEFFQRLLSRRVSRRDTLPAIAVVGGALAAACGDASPDQSGGNLGVEHGYYTMDENFETVGVDSQLVEKDMRLKDSFERYFTQQASNLIGNEIGFYAPNGSEVLRYDDAVICKVKGVEDNSQTTVRFVSEKKSKRAGIEIEQRTQDSEPAVQLIYNETRFHTATELIDRTYPLRWLRPEEKREEKVTREEWETLRDVINAVVEQASEDKRSTRESQDEHVTASEIVAKYDRYSQEAIALRLGGYISSDKSPFDEVSCYITLPLRNDGKQQLVFRNFYLYRDPEVVGITNPTTRTIWLNDGQNTEGIIFIGQDRSAWWYNKQGKPIWLPLSSEELTGVSESITEVFERAKLKDSL